MSTATADAVPADLGGRLRHFRQMAGLSREQAAARATPGFRTLCAWETGARTPGLVQLRELAALYGVPTVELLGEDDHTASGGAAA